MDFSTISSIKISANNFNLTSVFLKLLAMLIQELKEILNGQAHKFQDTYFAWSQIHQLTVMYHFKHTNHDILLKFLFQNPYKFLFRAHNLHQ